VVGLALLDQVTREQLLADGFLAGIGFTSDFNPIEKAFSKFKALLRKAAPGQEFSYGARIGAAGMGIADLSGEEFEETTGSTVVTSRY
jgi:hypothetical protein